MSPWQPQAWLLHKQIRFTPLRPRPKVPCVFLYKQSTMMTSTGLSRHLLFVTNTIVICLII